MSLRAKRPIRGLDRALVPARSQAASRNLIPEADLAIAGAGESERITENTLIRVAADLLLD